MITIKEIIENPITTVTANTLLTYGIAYVGRTYIAINPLHAALFSLATATTVKLGRILMKKINSEYIPHIVHRGIFITSVFLPAICAVKSGLFSSTQVLMVLAIMGISDSLYYTATSKQITQI